MHQLGNLSTRLAVSPENSFCSVSNLLLVRVRSSASIPHLWPLVHTLKNKGHMRISTDMWLCRRICSFYYSHMQHLYTWLPSWPQLLFSPMRPHQGLAVTVDSLGLDPRKPDLYILSHPNKLLLGSPETESLNTALDNVLQAALIVGLWCAQQEQVGKTYSGSSRSGVKKKDI